MFRHFKKDYIPSKLSLIALAISLKLNNDNIYILLNRAGYVLSKSIAFDMIIKTIIENDEIYRKNVNPVMYINNILFELDLPLLMTREI